MLGAIGKQKFTKALVVSGGASVVEVDVRTRPGRAVALLALRVDAARAARARRVLAAADPVDRDRARRPVHAAAPALGIYGVVFWIGESNFPGPLFGGVAVIFVLGLQGFILALIGEYLGRIQRDVEGRPLYTIDREL